MGENQTMLTVIRHIRSKTAPKINIIQALTAYGYASDESHIKLAEHYKEYIIKNANWSYVIQISPDTWRFGRNPQRTTNAQVEPATVTRDVFIPVEAACSLVSLLSLDGHDLAPG